ncbi:hypothetical protein [Bosea sp. ANAM02]|uniref:hypothetical protein n=1 Tax=Bosea sp. ANAM02 TaxID=2020412 RepID=UPI00140F2B46|nr:hypothetical protein [Bosea sp. ANAM02]BCB20059.1 hypothetical protein OCUBac02_29530 [Bosea sp. ANAM02]
MTATHYSQFAIEPSPIIPQGQSVAATTTIGGGAVHSGTFVDPSVGSPIETLQTRSGRPVDPFNAGPGDIVTVMGVQTTVANAIQLGILHRHPATGALVERGAETGKTQEQFLGINPGATKAHAAPVDDPGVAPAPLARSAFTFQSVLRDRVPGTELAGAYSDYLERGTLTDAAVNRIASHLMITPDQARDNLAAYADALDDQRMKSVARFGIDDIDGFDAWAKQAKPEALKKARAQHLTHGSVEGYRGLAQMYFETLDTIDPERILTANFGSNITARLSGGRVLLKVPGMGEMPWRMAVSQGIVRLR